MDERLFSPSVARNRAPIATILRRFLPATGTVLEIASGTGEHTNYFAGEFPGLVFQPSDPEPIERTSIAAWNRAAANVRAPLAIDVSAPDWETDARIPRPLVAILCINMIHISPWSATMGLMRGASLLLASGGTLYLYGAYRRAGAHTAVSNAEFDTALRARNPQWGVRDIEAVIVAAEARGLTLVETIEMPANNLSVTFRHGPAPDGA